MEDFYLEKEEEFRFDKYYEKYGVKNIEELKIYAKKHMEESNELNNIYNLIIIFENENI